MVKYLLEQKVDINTINSKEDYDSNTDINKTENKTALHYVST